MHSTKGLGYKKIPKAKLGTLLGNTLGSGVPEMGTTSMGNFSAPKKVDVPGGGGKGGGGMSGMGLGSLAGAGVEAAMGAIFKQEDAVAGAKEAGLDSAEIAEIESAGSGLGTASNIAGTIGDIGGNIPGPWGAIIGGGGQLLESGLGLLQGDKQANAAAPLIAAHKERGTDKAKMEGLANLGATPVAESGGLLYKKPNKILSLLSGGSRVYKDGGKTPELLWNHSFNISFPASTLEKKVMPVRVFKRGGKFDNPDKTNVIVTGARHHEDNSMGDKGVPVIDNAGEKVFEIETGELVLTKEATVKLEKFMDKYKKVEIHEDKAHSVLQKLGEYFKTELTENLHNYEANAI